MPTPVCTGVVQEADDTKFPLWLATAMRPAGGYGATIWAHRCDRGATRRPARSARRGGCRARRPAPPARPRPAARLARLAVAGRGHERGPDPLGRAGPQQVGVRRGRGAHEHEVGLRRRAARRCPRRSARRAPPRPPGWCRRPGPRSRWPGGCGGRRSRTCPGGSTRRRPRRRAARTGRGTARRRSRAPAAGRRGQLRPRRARRRRRGTPSAPTISGLTSTRRTSGRAVASADSPTSTSARRSAVDRRLAAERARAAPGSRARRSSPRRPRG